MYLVLALIKDMLVCVKDQVMGTWVTSQGTPTGTGARKCQEEQPKC